MCSNPFFGTKLAIEIEACGLSSGELRPLVVGGVGDKMGDLMARFGGGFMSSIGTVSLALRIIPRLMLQGPK